VTLEDFNQAIERMVAGLEKKNRVLNENERRGGGAPRDGPCHGRHGASRHRSGPQDLDHPRGIGALGYTMQRRPRTVS